jgi:hypothetical protein
MRVILTVVLAASVAAACNRAGTTSAAAAGQPAGAAAGASSADARELTIPAGTRFAIVLDTTVGSDLSHVEDPVQAHLSRAVAVNGVTVVPEGTRVSGVVTDATRSGRVEGRAHVSVRFDTLVLPGDQERYQINTSAVGRTAKATHKKDALEIIGPAAGGALIGGLIGGGKGALIGTAAGGGAGTAVVLSTRGKEIHLPRGAELTLKLSEPVKVKIRQT